MNLRYLLDTDIVSEPLKVNPSNRVLDKLKSYEQYCALSSITWHELNYGVSRLPDSRRKEMISSYLLTVLEPSFSILPYDQDSSVIYAGLRYQAEKGGRVLPFADSQIASIALAHDLTLVTRNVKDFSGIPGLMLENWFE